MENKELYFFNIDFSLLRNSTQLCVIDKYDPTKIIFKIHPIHIPMMKSVYKNTDYVIDYNDDVWYLSEKLWNEIKEKTHINDINRIGITYRDFSSDELLKKQISETEKILSSINVSSESDIILLSGKNGNDERFENIKIIKKMIECKFPLSFKKVYFVNNIDGSKSDDITTNRKMKIILEYLTGYKIKNDRFVDLKQYNYNKISYFDRYNKNIDAINRMQFLFEKILINTEHSLKKEILNYIEITKPKYTSNLVTTNKLNPFIKKEYTLLLPNSILLFNE